MMFIEKKIFVFAVKMQIIQSGEYPFMIIFFERISFAFFDVDSAIKLLLHCHT
jgi:hypothetical protein